MEASEYAGHDLHPRLTIIGSQPSLTSSGFTDSPFLVAMKRISEATVEDPSGQMLKRANLLVEATQTSQGNFEKAK